MFYFGYFKFNIKWAISQETKKYKNLLIAIGLPACNDLNSEEHVGTITYSPITNNPKPNCALIYLLNKSTILIKIPNEVPLYSRHLLCKMIFTEILDSMSFTYSQTKQGFCKPILREISVCESNQDDKILGLNIKKMEPNSTSFLLFYC